MSFLTGVDLAWSWGRGRLTQGGIPTVVTSLFGSITSHLDTGHSSWLVETKAIPVRCHMEVVVRPVGARVYTHREGQRGWRRSWQVGWRGGWRGNGRGCWWKCGRGVGWCLFFKRVKPECVRVYTQRDATPGFSYSSLCGSWTGFLQTILSCSATHARSMYTFSNVWGQFWNWSVSYGPSKMYFIDDTFWPRDRSF